MCFSYGFVVLANAVVPVSEEAIRDPVVTLDVLQKTMPPAEVPKPRVAVVTPPAVLEIPNIA